MGKEELQRILQRPLSIQETGLTMGQLTALALKLVYNSSEISAKEISLAVRLPFAGIMQAVLEQLDRERLVTITGAEGFGEQAYRYTLSQKGSERVHQALERSQYLGPAPVPLERYNAMIRTQAVGEILLDEATVRSALEGLVVNPATFDKIGPALNSGQSVFLYGPSGNGKTASAPAWPGYWPATRSTFPTLSLWTGTLSRSTTISTTSWPQRNLWPNTERTV